jgi:hypothetical protein
MQSMRKISQWKNLKLKTMLSVRYSNYKAPFGDEQRGLSSRYIALHARDTNLFDEIPEDALRWRVSSRTCASTVPMVVMRTHLRRRWKNAFVDVLRKMGYELDGGKIVDGYKMPSLRGTLDVTIHNGNGLTKPYADLLRDAQTVIAALEKLQLPSLKPPQSFRPTMKRQKKAKQRG